jgi:uncharacterized protein (TIGR02118 family)
MFRVMVSYPNVAGAKFDLEYYLTRHMPMVQAKLTGHGLTGWSVDQGIAGGLPGTDAEFLIQAFLTFESVEAFERAMASEGAEILADIPNYTSIQPRIQVNKMLAQEEVRSAAA